MKHNYFCRFLFITIFFLVMQASLKGGPSISTMGITLNSHESDIGRDPLTEPRFVYGNEESFTMSAGSSPTIVTFDAKALTPGMEIPDNNNSKLLENP